MGKERYRAEDVIKHINKMERYGDPTADFFMRSLTEIAQDKSGSRAGITDADIERVKNWVFPKQPKSKSPSRSLTRTRSTSSWLLSLISVDNDDPSTGTDNGASVSENG